MPQEYSTQYTQFQQVRGCFPLLSVIPSTASSLRHTHKQQPRPPQYNIWYDLKKSGLAFSSISTLIISYITFEKEKYNLCVIRICCSNCPYLLDRYFLTFFLVSPLCLILWSRKDLVTIVLCKVNISTADPQLK